MCKSTDTFWYFSSLIIEMLHEQVSLDQLCCGETVEVTNCSDSTGTLCATRVVVLRTTSCGSLLVARILDFLDFRI